MNFRRRLTLYFFSSRQLGVVLDYRRSDLLFFFEQLAEITGGLNVEPELGTLFEKLAEFERHFGRDAAATENDFVYASRADAECTREGVLGNAHGHEIIFEQNFTGSDGGFHRGGFYPQISQISADFNLLKFFIIMCVNLRNHGWRMFFCEDETFVLKRWGSEVDQQAFCKTGGFEVVDDLGFFRAGEGLERFQFDNYITEANEVGSVDALEFFAPIANDEIAFAFEWDGGGLKLHLQRFLVDGFQKAVSEFGVNPHGGSDDCVGRGISIRRFRRFAQIKI